MKMARASLETTCFITGCMPNLDDKHNLGFMQLDCYNVFKLLILIPDSLASDSSITSNLCLNHQLWMAGILSRIRFICHLNVHTFMKFCNRRMLLWHPVSHSNPPLTLVTEPIDRSMKYYWYLALPPGDRCRQEMCHRTAVNLLWI